MTNGMNPASWCELRTIDMHRHFIISCPLSMPRYHMCEVKATNMTAGLVVKINTQHLSCDIHWKGSIAQKL